MDILIIGGTRFLGKALVEAASSSGHSLTLLNRGQSNPGWFPELEQLHADRNSDLSILHNRRWDAAIDTCAYFPRQVRSLLQTIQDSINHYTFISSISVYKDFSQPGLNEDSALATIADPQVEEITGETYGALKALCEAQAMQLLPGRTLVLRPGLIVGPFDPSDRFTYWPVRVAKGGEVLAPDSPHWSTQVIDVRDLANWTLRLVEQGVVGVFNATGPQQPLTFGQVLEASREVSRAQVEFTWVSTDFLLSKGVQPWSEIPLWVPGEENAGLDQVDIGRAISHGLTFRPLEQTIRDTLAWESTRPADHPWKAGLPHNREIELLSEWKHLHRA